MHSSVAWGGGGVVRQEHPGTLPPVIQWTEKSQAGRTPQDPLCTQSGRIPKLGCRRVPQVGRPAREPWPDPLW